MKTNGMRVRKIGGSVALAFGLCCLACMALLIFRVMQAGDIDASAVSRDAPGVHQLTAQNYNTEIAADSIVAAAQMITKLVIVTAGFFGTLFSVVGGLLLRAPKPDDGFCSSGKAR